MRFRPKNMFIGELLYLYFRFSNIDIFYYDNIINDIFLAFYEIKKSISNGSDKPFKNIKVSKKSIDKYKFLKQIYINFIYKN